MPGSADTPAPSAGAGASRPAGGAPVIVVGPVAAEKMREYMRSRGKDGKALRIWLKGLSRRVTYGMAFDDCRPGDVQVACDGFTIVMDPLSASIFDGAHLKWIETAAGGRGFALELPAFPGAVAVSEA